MQTLDFHMHAHVYTHVALHKQTCYMHTTHTQRERENMVWGRKYPGLVKAMLSRLGTLLS